MMQVFNNTEARRRLKNLIDAYYKPSTSELSYAIGISQSYYHRWMQGNAELSEEMLTKVEKFLEQEGF